MAQMVINIANASADRVVDAFALRFGYQATINGSPNPQTKQEFARQQVVKWVKEQVRAAEGNAAAQSARATAEQSADTIAIT